MECRVFPPVDGSVTLPETVDFHTKHNPDLPVYVFAEDGKPNPTSISYLEFGRAADRVAHHVRPRRDGPSGQVVAFVALSDTLLYQAVTFGIMRAGLIPYPMSPRNTGAAIFKLLKDTSCHRLITTQETLKPLINDIQVQISSSDPTYQLSIEEVPPLFEIFPKLGKETSEDSFVPYPRDVRPPLDDVMMYLHSSGSTGLPKTIPQTFRSMVHWASFPPVLENRKPGLKMAGMALPAFHTLGIIVQLLVGHFAMQPVGLYPPIANTPKSQPMMPTPGNILDHTIRSGCNGLIIIPALLQIWAQDKASINVLAGLEYVAFSGGSVPSKLGNLLTESGVYLTPVYGGTEFGAPTHYFRQESDEKDWEYLAFSDSVNIRWESQGDGTFELQYLTSDKHHLSVENLDDIKGYASSDLWVPHPTKSYFWKIVGRKDDVIVHASGEKTVPAPMEDILMSSPYIMGTVIFGRERDQAGVIIELKAPYAIDPKNEHDLINARNLLWPIVEEANKVAPGFSRIFKEMILITSPGKPLPRAGKGTVMRKAALQAYADEIDAIYGEVNAIEEYVVESPSSWDLETTISWLHEQIEDIHGPVSAHDDIFEQGMDSLGVTILRRRIVNAMKSEQTLKAAQLVSQTTIYNHSSIERLAAFLVGIIADPDTFVLTSNRTDAMELMINKYSAGLSEPIRSTSAERQPGDGAVVLLTGTTGNLGAQILDSLLQDPRVQTVYTLNRPSSSKSVTQRQLERFADKGLNIDLLKSSRLVSLEGEASHRNLGLDSAVYDELRQSVTTIIHSAWRLDFNLSLSSFEPNVQGTRNLIDLARSSVHASSIRFLFTSSISSAASWDKTRGLYPEEVVPDTRYAVGNGYGESKYVAERVLAQSGIRATSLRIGQITGGSPNGSWATTDWVPILVKSSIRLGALPSSTGVSSWIPLHAVSQAILDVNWSEGPSPAALNLIHPRPVSFNAIVSAINDAMVTEGVVPSKIPVVDFREWFSMLERHSKDVSEDTLKEIPAIKLADFFRRAATLDSAALVAQGDQPEESGGLTGFSVNKMLSISKTIDTLPSIGQTDASAWIKYWKKVAFL